MISTPNLTGDINGGGRADLLDVELFVDLLVSNNFQSESDLNFDDVVNLLDVELLFQSDGTGVP